MSLKFGNFSFKFLVILKSSQHLLSLDFDYVSHFALIQHIYFNSYINLCSQYFVNFINC
jgi:hypothetical protein